MSKQEGSYLVEEIVNRANWTDSHQSQIVNYVVSEENPCIAAIINLSEKIFVSKSRLRSPERR